MYLVYSKLLLITDEAELKINYNDKIQGSRFVTMRNIFIIITGDIRRNEIAPITGHMKVVPKGIFLLSFSQTR